MWIFLKRLALSVLSTAVAYLLSPKQKFKSSTQDDLDIGRPKPGAVIGKPYGSPWIIGDRGPQIIWSGDFKSEKIRDGGKK